MKTSDQNRLNMVTTTRSVLAKPDYASLWDDIPAFTDSVDKLDAKITQINQQSQIAENGSGAADAKKLARATLCKSVCEVMGAVQVYAAKNADAELGAKVGYAPSKVVAGKITEVIARCRTIWTAANDNADALTDLGITAAKLTALKKAIDAFDKLKNAPREDQSERSAAGKLLPVAIGEAVAILGDELDGLMPQFQDANPNFYNGYFAARVVVDLRGGHADKAQPGAVADPAAAPLTKKVA
ncbi:MAG: hypothetical protein HY043_18420 [Verrucomicrobia bacterium]|nr:hypothetical protein [Verrucomicrobiota bacterium]